MRTVRSMSKLSRCGRQWRVVFVIASLLTLTLTGRVHGRVHKSLETLPQRQRQGPRSRSRSRQRQPLWKQPYPESQLPSKSQSQPKSNAESQALLLSTRGGASVGFTQSNVLGALYFLLLDASLRKAFKAWNINFPSMMAGTVLLFTVLVVAESMKAGWGDNAFRLINPGAALLAKWLPVFFVPGLAMLPLAPKVTSAERVLAIVILGFFFSSSTVGGTSVAIRSLQGKLTPPPPAPLVTKKGKGKKNKTPPPPAAAAPTVPSKPYSVETLRNLGVGALVTGLLRFGLSLSSVSLAKEWSTFLDTLFFICVTVGSFVFGSRMPPAVVAVVHPLWFSTGMTWAAMALGGQFKETLRTYRTSSLSPGTAGAGDYLLHLLGPAVIALSVPMYSRKALLADNLLVCVATAAVSALGGLFGTALVARALLSDAVVKLSVLPRNVTTALAMALSALVGGDVSITASVVVLTGIFGATVGRRWLDFLRIHDPVSRGLAIGGAAQGLGVASLAVEPDAFPFAAIAMVTTAVTATVAVSIPAVKDALLTLAGVTVAL